MSPTKLCLLSALYNFASTSGLLKYFRRRYDELVVREVNQVLRLKGKCLRTAENVRFLKKCLEQRVSPSFIKVRVRKSRPKDPTQIERAFIRDEVEKSGDLLRIIGYDYRQKLQSVSSKLSFFDHIRLCKLVNQTAEKLLQRERTSKERTLRWLVKQQVGECPLNHSVITNLSDVELTEAEKNVLCRGLNFGIPPRVVKEEVQAEFELCWQQLGGAAGRSRDSVDECAATLSGLALKFANTSVDKANFPLDKDHLKAMKDLRKREDIIITRPDKGNGVVVMDVEDYKAKMLQILSQEGKSERLGHVDECDHTLLREKALQSNLQYHQKAGHISQEIMHRVWPVGSSRPRMYGLPKIHKANVPLRPILSMINAPQYELSKWLAELLKPVVKKYSTHTIKDTFHFCNNIEQWATDQGSEEMYMCSFDVVSLFTNVPLQETVQICLDALYRDPDIPKPSLPEKQFRAWLLRATTDVEFSFDDVMYRQIDGVAMGSPLGPVLANIFVGYCEMQIDKQQWPTFYNRFVDDAFTIFSTKERSCEFLRVLNSLHPALTFTMEGEVDNALPFMDVLVERVGSSLVRSVYRKPTFTGLYTRWDSFAPTNQKINLIKSLTSRAVRICSEEKLPAEIVKLKVLFAENGYPAGLVDRTIKMVQLQRGTENRRVLAETSKDCCYLRLPWIGPKSKEFREDIEGAIRTAFPTITPRVVFTTRHAFNGRVKDVLPPLTKSLVVYQFRCCCGQTYIGKTSKMLTERIDEHVPMTMLEQPKVSGVTKKAKEDSAITRHFRESPACIPAKEERTGLFSVITQARHQVHLDVLEALFIKKLAPSLCCQKQFSRTLFLF